MRILDRLISPSGGTGDGIWEFISANFTVPENFAPTQGHLWLSIPGDVVQVQFDQIIRNDIKAGNSSGCRGRYLGVFA